MSGGEILAHVPLFVGCTPDELAAIEGCGQRRSYETGESIVLQGTPGQAFFTLLSGRVEIVRDRRSLGSLGAGDFFGEMSLLDQAARSATINAVAPTECLMISSWDFRSMLEQHPAIAIKLLEVLSRRLRVADERLAR